MKVLFGFVVQRFSSAGRFLADVLWDFSIHIPYVRTLMVVSNTIRLS